MWRLVVVLWLSEAFVPKVAPRKGPRLAAAAVEFVDPFAVLGVDSRRFRFWSPQKRRSVVKRVAREQMFRFHPDTAEGAGDGAKLQAVLKASKALSSESGAETALKSVLRAEVPRWTSKDLSDYIRHHTSLPDAVADEFLAENVAGVDICGDPRYGGDDVENFVHALRVLGTTNEGEAVLVEAVIRDLTGVQEGWTFARVEAPRCKYHRS